MTSLHNEAINNYKTLVLYALKDIRIVELKRIIWEKIFNRKSQWYGIDLENLNIDDDWEIYSDLEIVYSD